MVWAGVFSSSWSRSPCLPYQSLPLWIRKKPVMVNTCYAIHYLMSDLWSNVYFDLLQFEILRPASFNSVPLHLYVLWISVLSPDGHSLFKGVLICTQDDCCACCWGGYVNCLLPLQWENVLLLRTAVHLWATLTYCL